MLLVFRLLDFFFRVGWYYRTALVGIVALGKKVFTSDDKVTVTEVNVGRTVLTRTWWVIVYVMNSKTLFLFPQVLAYLLLVFYHNKMKINYYFFLKVKMKLVLDILVVRFSLWFFFFTFLGH